MVEQMRKLVMERLIFHVDVNSAYLGGRPARCCRGRRSPPAPVGYQRRPGEPDRRDPGKVYPGEKVRRLHGRACGDGFEEMPASGFSPAGLPVI